MARIWSSGFEINSVGTAEWDGPVNSSPTTQGTVVRSGSVALQITSLTSTNVKGIYKHYRSSEGPGEYYFRFYFRYTTAPSVESSIFVLNDSSVAGTPTAYITISSSGQLRLYDEDGVIGSASSALSAGTWYRVEMHINTTLVAGSQVVEARIDGVDFATSSSRNIISTNDLLSLHLGGNLNGESNASGNWYFDDVAINDITGSFQNSYPGEGSIIHLRPIGAGDNSAWDEGTSTGADSWQAVDEVTPDDVTTYIRESTATGEISDFTLSALTGMIPENLITLIQSGVRFAGTASGTQAFKVRVKAVSGGTVESSSDIVTSSASYTTNAVASPKLYPLTLYDLPGASTTKLTYNDLLTAQIGVEHTIDNGTNAVTVSTLWLLVEYAVSTASPETLSTDFMSMEFSGEATLVVADASHSHTSDGVIVKAPVTFTLSTDLIEYIFEVILVMNDASHSHLADNVTVTQNTTLTVSDTLHAHTVDSTVMVMDTLLLVQETLHAHTADDTVLTVTSLVNAAKYFPFFG